MKVATKSLMNQIARTAITIEVIFDAIVWGSGILMFCGYAVYSAAHHVPF
jgi:hypothetical protein